MLVSGVVKRSWAWFLGFGLAVLASGCGATLNPTPATGGTSGAAGNGNGGVAGNGGAAGSPASDASADSGCGPDTDLMSDPDNCGSCGFRCCNGSCVQGYCFCDGPPGITCCSTDERGADGCYFQSAAVNILINPMNCGTCGNVCGQIRPARPAPASIPLRALQARAGPQDPAAPQAVLRAPLAAQGAPKRGARVVPLETSAAA